MRKNLTLGDLGDLLDQPILAVLATKRLDESVLLSPVWYEWREEGMSIAIAANSIKSKHIVHDPIVSAVVAEQKMPYRSFEISGEARLSSPDDIFEIIRRITLRYFNEEEANAYVESCTGLEMELIRIMPAKIRAWDYSDEMD